MAIHYTGSSYLHTPHATFLLRNILHVPQITKNLLSVQQFASDNNVFFEFHPDICFVKDLQSGKTLLQGWNRSGLYQLELGRRPTNKDLGSYAFVGERATVNDWHSCFGHPTRSTVYRILNVNKLPVQPVSQLSFCFACQLGKLHKLPFQSSSSVSFNPLDLVFYDIWGLAPVSSVNGFRYYIHFVDDFSKFTWIYPMVRKSDAYDIFVKFKATVENLFGCKIIYFQIDGGKEYEKLQSLFSHHGITHRLSYPHTYEQNGSAECKHRHIMDTGLTLLAHASVSMHY